MPLELNEISQITLNSFVALDDYNDDDDDDNEYKNKRGYGRRRRKS